MIDKPQQHGISKNRTLGRRFGGIILPVNPTKSDVDGGGGNADDKFLMLISVPHVDQIGKPSAVPLYNLTQRTQPQRQFMACGSSQRQDYPIGTEVSICDRRAEDALCI